ncbi:MAG: sterol desaturase/sphingolipid hydroxylase (fatty acid hydroxylase superfamily) [Halioglobus sp.]
MEEQVTQSGPLTTLVQQGTDYLWHALSSDVPADLHWPVLLLTLALAITLFIYRKGHGARTADGHERKTGLIQFLLPRDIYTHVSARVDIQLWVFDKLLRPIWAVTILATVGPATEQSIIWFLGTVAGESPALHSNLPWMLLYSLVTLLLYDLVFFITHFSMHKFPVLWAIHKTHHSAEVLTPLTRHREHFLATPVWDAGAALSYGTAAGIFGYLFAGDITEATLFNIGFFTALFGFNGTFRHYHVQFGYPRWLEKWLQSPAMHHIHHSYLEPHRDTNFAAVTSIYDRMAGTLYHPQKDEYTPWGLGPETQAENRSFWDNTMGPFRDWYALLRGEQETQSTDDKPSSD